MTEPPTDDRPGFVAEKRCRWRSRAASTRAWIAPVLDEQVRRLAQAVVR